MHSAHINSRVTCTHQNQVFIHIIVKIVLSHTHVRQPNMFNVPAHHQYMHRSRTCSMCMLQPSYKGTPGPHHKYQFETDTHNESSEAQSLKYPFETY